MRTLLALLAIVLAVGVMAPGPEGMQSLQDPAIPPPPAVPGGRGPNPFLGLSGWIDSPTSGPDAPRFEVASVRRNANADGSGRGGQRTLVGGQVRTTGSTLRMLIRMAYRLALTDEIAGGPPWIDSHGFDIDAKPAQPVTIAESALMMRTLLAERFQLQVRKEPRDMPVYALVRARRDGTLGAQIRRPADECVMVAPAAALPAGADAIDPARLAARPAPGQPGRRGRGPALGASADPAAASIFTALQEQLGLRLDPQRGPVDVLAVVRAELPSEN